MKPFLKWVGGKTQILDTINNLIPTCKNYHEPFLGGGSVLLAVLESGKVSGKVYASDVNKHLVNLYRDIQKHPDEFIKKIQELIEPFKNLSLEEQEVYYYDIRKKFNAEPNTVMFLFLNKTCFRGVYREGPNGFNVPFGHNKKPEIINEEHIRNVSKLIQKVIFTDCSFTESLKKVQQGDFVYLDPPYAPVNVTSFVNYTAKGFSGSDHETLFEMCKKLPCKWLMSNADVVLVKESFKQFQMEVISCRRAINSKNPESRVNEVLVKNL
jgi:DNA adenine methylase